MQAVIVCGGLGTRLGSLTKDTPKPMLEVAGKPILHHIVEFLREHSIDNITLAAGYKADVIEKYFSDLPVKVSVEKEPLGTAGPLKLIDLEEDFVVVYGDVFIDFDISRMIKIHKNEKALATILVRPSTHPWNADLIQTKDNKVTEFVTEKDPKRNYQNLGNASVYVLNKKIMKYISGKCEFMEEVFPKALKAGEKIIVHHLDGFVRDLGKPARFKIVEKYLENKEKIEFARNNPGKIDTVFLDRDGVLIKDTDHVSSVSEVEMLPNVKEAIKLLNDKGMKVFVVTNQPGIARGLFDDNTVNAINNKIQDLIKPAKIESFYYCPHHPETQYGEGVIELRKACDCRKPSPGMILQAVEDFKLKLENSIIIGDSQRDLVAGKKAGIRGILVTEYKDLLEAVNSFLEE